MTHAVNMDVQVGPMTPRRATDWLRAKARDPSFRVWRSAHFGEQLELRGLVMGDFLHLFKNGFVLEEAQPTSRECEFKYILEGVTPNSGGRTVAAVVIPYPTPAVKVLTIMWKDEVRIGS